MKSTSSSDDRERLLERIAELEAHNARLRERLASVRSDADGAEHTADAEAASADLHRTARRLRAIFDSLPCGVWMADAQGTYVMQNERCVQVFGDQVGRRLADLELASEVKAYWREIGRRAFAGEVVRADLELVIDGEVHVFDEIVAPVIEGGRAIGVLGFHLDLGRLREAQRRFESERAHALRMEGMTRIARASAQEFGAMLEAIDEWAETAGQANPGDEQLKYLKAIRSEVAQGSTLIHALRRLQPDTELPEEPLDFNSCLARAIETLRPRLGLPQPIEVVHEGVSRSMIVDPAAMAQLLEQLLLNASEASPASAPIVITSRPVGLRDAYYRLHPWIEPGHYMLMRVQDRGHGMRPEIRSRVFEPYFSTRVDHAGMGLPIAHGIVRRHEGFISIDSDAEGTRVDVLLPAIV